MTTEQEINALKVSYDAILTALKTNHDKIKELERKNEGLRKKVELLESLIGRGGLE